MEKTNTIPKVFLPEVLENSLYVGSVFGFYHPDTDIYNILAWDDNSRDRYSGMDISYLGEIYQDQDAINSEETTLVGIRREGGLYFYVGDTAYKKEHYNLIQNIFSRNTGILETDWMLNKTVLISGCGSVGSLVALELAKSGVGNFVLVDNDILNFHNICRHQCSIRDVGEYKVNAVRERILEINPYANVIVYKTILELLPKEVFDEHFKSEALIISCADSRESDNYASQLASIYTIPFVSIGFWERAFAGEVFYFIPAENMPCYECSIGTGEGYSSRQSANHRIYTTQESLDNVNFEPGISVDINFVTTIAIKLILDLLNRNNPNYTIRLLDYLTQFTLICNTNNPKIGGTLAEIFSHPLQVTRSIMVTHQKPCPPCKYGG